MEVLLVFILLVFFAIYKLLDRVLRIPYIGRLSDRYILITGCDTGFGHAAAKRLDSMGCHVFAGCLTENGERELKKSCSDRLMPISLDVTKPESIKNAFKVIKNRLDKEQKGLLLFRTIFNRYRHWQHLTMCRCGR